MLIKRFEFLIQRRKDGHRVGDKTLAELQTELDLIRAVEVE